MFIGLDIGFPVLFLINICCIITIRHRFHNIQMNWNILISHAFIPNIHTMSPAGPKFYTFKLTSKHQKFTSYQLHQAILSRKTTNQKFYSKAKSNTVLDELESLNTHLIQLGLIVRPSSLVQPLKNATNSKTNQIFSQTQFVLDILQYFDISMAKRHIKVYLRGKRQILVLNNLFHVTHNNVATFYTTRLFRTSLFE